MTTEGLPLPGVDHPVMAKCPGGWKRSVALTHEGLSPQEISALVKLKPEYIAMSLDVSRISLWEYETGERWPEFDYDYEDF